jgi:hypothetical protein
MVNASVFFFDSARPEAVHQHTLAVRERRLVIGALDFNRHGFGDSSASRGFQNATLQT